MNPSKFKVKSVLYVFSILHTVCYIILLIMMFYNFPLITTKHSYLCHNPQTAFLSGGNRLLTPTHVSTYTNMYVHRDVNKQVSGNTGHGRTQTQTWMQTQRFSFVHAEAFYSALHKCT